MCIGKVFGSISSNSAKIASPDGIGVIMAGKILNRQLKEKITKKEKDVEVIYKGELNTLPVTTVDCPKCHHKKAYFCPNRLELCRLGLHL